MSCSLFFTFAQSYSHVKQTQLTCHRFADGTDSSTQYISLPVIS